MSGRRRAGEEGGFWRQHVTFTLIGAVSDLDDPSGDGTLSNYCGANAKQKPHRPGDNNVRPVTVNIPYGVSRRRCA